MDSYNICRTRYFRIAVGIAVMAILSILLLVGSADAASSVTLTVKDPGNNPVYPGGAQIHNPDYSWYRDQNLNSNGQTTFTGLASGTYGIEAYGDGMYIGGTGNFNIGTDQSLSKSITSVSKGYLKVKVYYSGGSTPLANAIVKLYNHGWYLREGTTNSNGEYTFTVWPNNPSKNELYKVYVYYNNNEVGSKTSGIDVDPTSTYTASITTTVTISPPSVNNLNHYPFSPKELDQVNLYADVISAFPITSVKAHWSKDNFNWYIIDMIVFSGNTYITSSKVPAQSEGTKVYYKVLATNAGGTTISTTNSYTVQASPGSLTGRVTDPSGNGISGATVTLGSWVTNTDINGYYSFTDKTKGTYSFKVEKTGYNTYTSTVTIVAGTTTKNVQLTISAPPLTAEAGGPYSGTVNIPISFSGSASGGTPPYTYSWNFGDSTTGTGQNPSHPYTSAGTKTATLTVTDSAGKTAQDTAQVTVDSPPLYVSVTESSDPVTSGGTSQVTVHVTTSGGAIVSSASVSVSVTGGSLNPASGNTDSNGDFKTTYTAPSVTSSQTYTISVTATKSGYTSGSGSDQITVNPPALTAEAGGPYSGKVNSPISFSGSASGGTPPYSFSWNFGDGATGTGQNPSHPYTSAGTKTATLTVTDGAGKTAQDTASVTVSASVELIGLEVNQAVQDWTNSIPLIADKTTYVRAHIQAPSEVSVNARLRGFRDGVELPGSPISSVNPGTFKARPNAAARRGNLWDSLNFRLPTEWLHGTVELRVERIDGNLDCKEAASTPNDCSVGVTFSPNAVPEIKFVSMRWTDAAGTLHEPSETDIDELNQRLIAIYPINDLDYTTGQENLGTITNPDLNIVNSKLKDMRFWDFCWSILGCDNVYYGVLHGPDVGGLTTPYIFPGPVASGTMPDEPFVYGRNRHAHEIGHVLGRYHAVHSSLGLDKDGKKQGWCNEQPADPEAPDFPYSFLLPDTNIRVATLGPMDQGQEALIYGLDTHWDTRSIKVVDPTQNFELMSYCGSDGYVFNPTRWRWISKFTYEDVHTAINNNFGSFLATVAPGAMQDYLIVRGTVDIKDNTAEFQPFGSISSSVSPPLPSAGDYSLQLLDATSNVITEVSFQSTLSEPDLPGMSSNVGMFLIPVLADPTIKKAVILHNGNVLTSRTASNNPPTVQVLFPNGGEILSQDLVVLRWSGSDTDSDRLTYSIQYSSDGGITWETLAVDWPKASYEIGLNFLKGTNNGLIKVMASDGFNTAMDNSNGVFSVANHAPKVSILAPTEKEFFAGSQQIFFEALAQDLEDGSLSGSSIQWTSSIDGLLGTDKVLNMEATKLSEGTHVITVKATDSGGLVATASISISVIRATPPKNVDLSVSQTSLPNPVIVGNTLNYTITVTNNGPDEATGVMLTDILPSSVTFVSATSTQGTFSRVGNIVTFDLGTLSVGNISTMMVAVATTEVGQIGNTISVTSIETDPIPANNVSDVITLVKSSDTISPTTTAMMSGTAGNNSWNTSDVQITLTSIDNEGGSGVNNTEYSLDSTNWNTYIAPFTITAEGTTTVYYHSTDKAGNVESTKIQTIKIDKTPPSISGDVTTSPNANGWYNSSVVVNFTASDALSGIDTLTPDIILTTEGSSQSVTGTVTDRAGNSNSTTVSGINIDRTPPTITGSRTPSANSYGWNNVNVTVHFDCSDSLSDIDTCTPDSVLSTEGAGQSASGTARDKAGNSAHVEVDGINIDKTPPNISISGVTDGSYYNIDVTPIITITDTNLNIQSVTLNDVPYISGTTVSTAGSYKLVALASDIAENNASKTLTFVINQPPVANASGPYIGIEGQPITFNASASYDPDSGDAITSLEWDFDNDGTTDATGMETTWTWSDDYAGQVSLKVTDSHGANSSNTTTVTILNAPPVVEVGLNLTVNENDTVSFSGSFTDSGTADTHTIVWDFGDGSTGSGTLTPAHTYSDNGIYTVKMIVTDDDGGSGSDTVTVIVNNIAPTVNAGSDATVNEGDTFSSSGSFTDPGKDTWTATVDYGDDSGIQPLTLNADKTYALSHIYADNSVYTVTVNVTDDDGDSGSGTVTVIVNNVAPVVDAGSDSTINEGDTFSSTGKFTDPGSDTWTATVDYGDGSVTQSLSLNPDKGFVLNHVYMDNGVYTLTVNITDDDGGSSSDTTTITVNNIAPKVDTGTDAAIIEGDTFSSSGSFIDPGDDTWTATVDYGDGSGVQSLTLNADKTFALSHAYADNGIYTITVNVIDEDGSYGSNTTTVTVNNAAPTVNAGTDTTINEGEMFLSSGSFIDPGNDTWTALVDYGDGTGIQPLTLNSDKTYALNHIYTDNNVYAVTVTVTDDDGGSSSDTASVTVSNVAPTVDAGSDATINEGNTFSSSGSFTDPGKDTWTATVDYGDGTGIEPLILNADKTYALSHVYVDNGIFTVTINVKDDDGGSGLDSATVTVNNVAPVVETGKDQTVQWDDTLILSRNFTDPGNDTWSAEINYGDGSQVETGIISGKIVTGTHMYSTPGTYTSTLTVNDDDGGSGSGNVQVTVTERATDLNYTGDLNAQYSDIITLKAQLNDSGKRIPLSGKSIKFTLGSQTVTAITGVDGIASSTLKLDQPRGIYDIKAEFAGDDRYGSASDIISFSINYENASVTYTGDTIVPSTSGSINLRATLEEMDTDYGDLTEITVNFTIYKSSDLTYSNPIVTVPSVTSVSVTSSGVGLGTAKATINNLPVDDYMIVARIASNNYYLAITSTPTPLTVYEPTGQFTTGGGWILDPTGSHGNFGFTVKYNKQGKIQGNSIYVYHLNGFDYIVKSNAWIGLAIKGNTSTFQGKASLQIYDPTTGLLQTGSSGNFQFTVEAVDNGLSNSPDTYKITVLDKDGLVYHTATGQLQGGNIVIHEK